MKIAVAAENGKVSEHFGHCEGFTIYEAVGTEIKNEAFVQNPGHQPGFLPVFLKEKGTDVIIAGGMGQMAQTLFSQQGITVVVGASGDCEQAAKGYLEGTLKSSESVCREHENADECGGH